MPQRPSEISLGIVEEQAAVTQTAERENNGSRVGVKIHWLALKVKKLHFILHDDRGENKHSALRLLTSVDVREAQLAEGFPN